MAANGKDREQLDPFSMKVREKLAEHRLPVDTDCWEVVSERLAAADRRKRSVQRIGWAFTAAAAIACLLGLFLWDKQGKTDVPKEEKPWVVTTDTFPLNTVPSEPVCEQPPHKTEPLVSLSLPVDTFAWLADWEEETDVTLSGVQVPVHAAERAVGPEAEQAYRADWLAQAAPPKSRSKGWQLGTHLGTGGHLSFDLFGEDLLHSGPSDDPIPGDPHPPIDGGEDDFASFPNVDCVPPLTFGLTVRKPLSGRLALESGLVYTYLYTKMSDAGWGSRRASLRLHYLGIPLNLVVRLWKHPRWNIYLSGGGMLEKGLRARYRLETQAGSNHRDATRRDGVQGVQWSLNLSLGFSYRFYRDWHFYLEPRYSYYFDCNQPINYRTENPSIVGISAGIRFELH